MKTFQNKAFNYGMDFIIKFTAMFFVFMFSLNLGFSQDVKNDSIFSPRLNDSIFFPNLQLGVSAGPSIFFGDIKENPFLPTNEYIKEWRFAYGLNVNYNVSQVFTIRLQALYGELAGSRNEDNIWFENDYYEFNLNTAVNLNNLFSEKRNNRLVTIYGVVGFGVMNYNTVVQRLDEYYVLKRVGYGNGNGVDGRYRQEFLMFGIGIDFRLSRRFNIYAESTNKMPFSDILDGVESGHYNDLYNYTSIGLTYRFAFLKKSAAKVKPQGIAPIAVIPKVDVFYTIRKEPGYQLIMPEDQPITPDFKVAGPASAPDPAPASQPDFHPGTTFIEYRVQILAEHSKPYSKAQISLNFNIPISVIREDKVGNYYVYTMGSFPNYSKALIRCIELRETNGISGAFVVAFKDGKRIFPVK